MCDTATQTILETIIAEWCNDQKMFTALDVSREAQRNRGVTLRHGEMKNDIHRLYANGQMCFTDYQGDTVQYERTTIQIAGVHPDPWLYFPPDADVSTYQSMWLTVPATVQTPASTITQNPPYSPATTAAITGSAQAGFPVDRRGRLWIPRSFVQSLGAGHGKTVDVMVDGKTLVIKTASVSALNDPNYVTSYLVDRHSNVAVSGVCFDRAGMSGTTYDIVTMNSAVVVKEA